MNHRKDTVSWPMLLVSRHTSMSLFPVVLRSMTSTISQITLMSVITLPFLPYLIVLPVQRQLDGNYVVKTEIVQKRSLLGYKGDGWYPFIKITTSNPKSVPKVRDKCFYNTRKMTSSLLYFGWLRLFDEGECTYNGLFNGPIKTYESNIVYTLRFMIDTKVMINWVQPSNAEQTFD